MASNLVINLLCRLEPIIKFVDDLFKKIESFPHETSVISSFSGWCIESLLECMNNNFDLCKELMFKTHQNLLATYDVLTSGIQRTQVLELINMWCDFVNLGVLRCLEKITHLKSEVDEMIPECSMKIFYLKFIASSVQTVHESLEEFQSVMKLAVLQVLHADGCNPQGTVDQTDDFKIEE